MNGRPLELLAYRFLGSIDEAEDIVQEARLRLLDLGYQPENPEAYLTRTVANLALDRLRHLKVERLAYSGPWLPQPVITDDDVTEKPVMVNQELGFGFMLMLEKLSAAERVVFVLREALGSRFREIGSMLGIETAAARQRYHRARRKLDSDSSEVTPSSEQKRLLEQMISTVSAGDAEGLVALMAEDAVLLADGGGEVSAAIRPVVDPRRIARVLVHLAGKETVAELYPELMPVNGGVALVLAGEGMIHACLLLEARQGLIRRLYVVRNPLKLGDLRVSSRAGRDEPG